MINFRIVAEPNEDRPGSSVYIECRSTGEFCSLVCAMNEDDPYGDGTRIPGYVVDQADNLQQELDSETDFGDY